MKLVREHINEKFTEDSDPIKDLGIGKQAIINDLIRMGLREEDVEFMPDLTFFIKDEYQRNKRIGTPFFDLQLKYFPEGKKQLIQDLADKEKSDLTILKDALKAGVSLEDVIYIVKYMISNEENRNHLMMQIDLYNKFLNRNQEQKKFDKENNIYVFIGYNDKIPVEINGKKYYEDKFQAEKMVKMNKYDLRDLHGIEMMEQRAKYGRHGEVYMVTLPKFIMDEKYYNEIPDEWRDLIDKYKKRI